MNYTTANDQLTGRNKSRRKIANNTYLERRENGDIAVRLHNTDIVTYKENGDTVLDTGGWKTVTTKARMNDYISQRIWSDRGVWYLGNGFHLGKDMVTVPYADGITLHADGTVSGERNDPKASFKLKKQIKAYVDSYMTELAAGNVPAPSNGDCWYCLFKTGKSTWSDKEQRMVNTNPTLGEAFKDTEHLKSHMSKDEQYFVPSLLMRAIERFPVSQAARWVLGAHWGEQKDGNDTVNAQNTIQSFGKLGYEALGKSLKRYLNEQFGMQG